MGLFVFVIIVYICDANLLTFDPISIVDGNGSKKSVSSKYLEWVA